ncbi:MAG TPA: hypothetical protein VGN72_10820 [Tepidisphaeraceae bacterium]|jgi:hypothetical protein|nr:hypothetical protein [Tepidisphaeraceae bacterium]
MMAFALLTASPAGAQMKQALPQAKGYFEQFDLKKDAKLSYKVALIGQSAPANVFHPGETPELEFQIENTSDRPLELRGHVEVIRYGQHGTPGDIWVPTVRRIEKVGQIPLNVDVAAKGFKNVTFRPDIPETKGGYALIFDFGEQGRTFGTSLVRTFEPSSRGVQYGKQALDALPAEVMSRLGFNAVGRMGFKYWPAGPQREKYLADLDRQMRQYHERGITVMAEWGVGPNSGEHQPLGRPRPHLSDENVMLDTKSDMVWLPSYDDDYEQFVYEVTAKYGWPHGPVTAVDLWNEPWEGISISGWGADMLRYRELYKRTGDAVFRARREAGVEVLIGGADSGSNTWDKLFPEGLEASPFWPEYLDFCGIHYQGFGTPALHPEWVNRKHYNGRVLIWDTESWVANADDRYAAVVAGNRAAGYDRALGTRWDYAIANAETDLEIRTDAGTRKVHGVAEARPLAAAYGAVQHFIGDREFKELLFHQSVPSVVVFDGYDGNPDDGTVVIVGDIAGAFGMRPDRPVPVNAHAKPLEPSRPPTMRIDARNAPFSLYDFYGNALPAEDGMIVVPLDERGYFLRASPVEPGSFARLLEAVTSAKLVGLEPIEVVAQDMVRPIDQRPTVRLRLTNQLERPVTAALDVKLGDLEVEAPREVSLAPRERKWVDVRVRGGQAAQSNLYPLMVRLDAGDAGKVAHDETMRVNWISRKTIAVDGDLSDWSGALPQTVDARGETAQRSFEEQTWLPFERFDGEQTADGVAIGYVAHDDDYFYFAAKVADATEHPGAIRVATRDDDAFFYPEVSQEFDPDKTILTREIALAGDARQYALQRPDSEGGVDKLWRPMAAKVGFDLALPTDRATRVSMYLLDPDDLARRQQVVEVLDPATGKQLAQTRVRKFGKGVYVNFVAAGEVRVVVRSTMWWYPTVAGVFLDPGDGQATAGAPLARFTGPDEETGGNWKGRYGETAHFLPGVEPGGAGASMIALTKVEAMTEHRWPENVRRFSYRKRPELPSSDGSVRLDNVLIGFNPIPTGEDGWLAHLPGRPPKLTVYKSTDYEYALNKVADEHGGGTEVWRLEVPGMPRKHFYPRQPAHAKDGPVSAARLAIAHDGGTRYVEAAIPWAEIPHVRERMQRSEPLKFSFRVNNDAGGPDMELSMRRSIAEGMSRSFHPDWATHWPNELEFGWEPAR